MTSLNLTGLLPDGARPLLVGVVGSTAYGLDHDGSDVDLLGTFLADPTSLMGLTQPSETIVTHEPDVTMHELRKLLALALRCNPTVTELLWLDSYEVCSPLGMQVLDIRQSLLSEPLVRSAYLGYAQAQMSKLLAKTEAGAADPRAEKHARHMFRLVEQGTDLLTTGTLTVRVRDREWYLGTLPGLTAAQVQREFAARICRFSEVQSILPSAPDVAAAERLLVEARIAAVRNLDLSG